MNFCLRIAVCACLAVWSACAAGAAVLEDKPFVVLYTDGHEDTAQETAAILQEALRELEQHLPSGREPITVMVCGSVREFHRNAGAYARPGVSGIAKSEAGVIAVKAPHLLEQPGDYAGTLRHELVHVLLARNIDVGVLPRWLNEGLAMSLSHEHRWNSTYHVARMYCQGRLIRYRDLEYVLQQPGVEMQFGDAYAQSLSMTRYLIDRLGEEGTWKLVYDLDTMTFGDAMRLHAGMGPPEFYDMWRGSLWKVALVFSVVSGFGVFQLMALLTIWAYLRKRRHARRILREWEEEEDLHLPRLFVWDEVESTASPLDEGDEEY